MGILLSVGARAIRPLSIPLQRDPPPICAPLPDAVCQDFTMTKATRDGCLSSWFLSWCYFAFASSLRSCTRRVLRRARFTNFPIVHIGRVLDTYLSPQYMRYLTNLERSKSTHERVYFRQIYLYAL